MLGGGFMNRQIDTDNLRLIVFDSAKELGEKVNERLLEMYHLDPNEYTFIVPMNQLFFEDGQFLLPGIVCLPL